MANKGSSGGSGGSGAIRAGRAFVELFAEDNKLYRALGRAEKRVAGFGSFLTKMGVGAGAIGLSVLAPIAGAIGAAVEHDAKMGDPKAVKVVNSLSAAWESMLEVVRDVGRVFTDHADIVEQFAGIVIAISGNVRQFIAQNKSLILVVAGVAAGLAAGGAALVAIGTGISVASMAFTALVAVMKLTAGAVLLLTSPIGVAVLAVGGLTAAFLLLTETGQEVTQSIGGYFKTLAGTIKEAWGGIADAISAGDLALAGKIALAGLTVEFQRGVIGLTQIWNDFKGFFVDGWHDAVFLVQNLWNDMSAFVAKGIIDLITTLRGSLGEFFETMVDVVNTAPIVFGPVAASIAKVAEKLRGVDTELVKKSVDQQRQTEEDRLVRGRRDQQEQSNAARQASIDAARADFAEAQREFERLTAEAAAKAATAKPFIASSAAIPSASIGSFSAAALSKQLNPSVEIQKKQLDVQGKSLDELRKIGETLGKGTSLVFGA